MSTTFTRYDYSVGTYTVDLAIADIDGDGKLDLVVSNAGDAAKLLVLSGDGTGSFTLSTDIDVTADSSSMGYVAVADMDGDGDLDVVYDSYFNYSVRVMLSDGAGGYVAGTPVSFGSRPKSMAIADVNGDGKADVVTTSQDGTITTLLGDGTGGFLTPITSSIGSRTGTVTLADMNGDGKLDLVTASDDLSVLSVLLGDGAGNFSSLPTYAMGTHQPTYANVADVNGDGKLDVVTSNLDGTISVLLGDGDGGFTSEIDTNVGGIVHNVELADLNGDGKLDLVASYQNSNNVMVRYGDGNGNFTSGTTVEVGYGPQRVKVADVNGDGQLDIVVTDYSSKAVTVLLGGEETDITAVTTDATGTLKIGDTITLTLSSDHAVSVTGEPELILSNGAHAVFAGLDEDGRPTFTYTIAEGDGDASNLSITGIDTTNGTMDGPEAALSFADPTTVSVGEAPWSVTTADVNGDGKLDLLTADFNTNAVSVRLGDGMGGFSGSTEVAVGSTPTSIVTADVNGDGISDLITSNFHGNSVSVRLGDGAGGFSGSTEIAGGHEIFSVAAADVNGDGKLDLLTANYLDNTVSVRLGDGTGGFSGSTEVSVADAPVSVKLADVNGDGKLDLLATSYSSNSVSVRLGDGTGQFSGSTTVSTGSTPYSIAVADVNGDGKLDILVANYASNSVSVRLGDGTGQFSGSTNILVGVAPAFVVAADLNGDGKIDLVTANSASNTVSVRLGDGLGGFSGSTDIAVGSQPNSVSVADVNGDGKLDLLVANFGGSTVSVILNSSNRAAPFAASSIVTANGAATGLAIDATRPDAPTLALAIDGGTSSTDLLTNDARLTIGRETGATLSYVVDGGEASATYDPTTLADGRHTVEVTQTDAAGNVSTTPGSITFTLDRTAPVALAAALSSDTGTFATDRVTSDGSLTVTGKETGATLSYVVDGGEASATYDPTALADGTHTVEVVQTDKAGNVSDAGSITFTLDSVAAAPTLALTSDTGTSSSDMTTSNAALTITGKETGATLTYIIDGGMASAGYDPTVLVDGTHTVEVTQTDKAGNVSDAGSITFTLDSVAAAPTLALTSDTGASSSDKTTSSGALTITGKETGATLTYIIDGGMASAGYDPTVLVDGTHTVEVTQTDKAGNVSDAGSITFTLDRVAAAPTLALTSDTGASSSDKTTSSGALTISGKEAGATLTYIIDGGMASAGYDPTVLADGTHTVEVTQTDKAGNVSDAGSITFTLHRAVPTAPVLVLTSDSGTSATDGITNSNGALTITGLEDGATLSYVVDGGTASDTYTPSSLADGTHTVELKQTDVAGNVSDAGSITFTLDRAAPTITGITASGPGIESGAGTLVTGETATFSVALSEAVTIDSASTLTLTLSNGETATYDATASTATKLVFDYTVTLEDVSSDLAVTKLNLDGAIITDAAGTAAILSGAVANPVGTLVIDGYTGTSGADSFKGTTGAETFHGLGGNDTYVVNNTGDRVIETANHGTDTVLASVSFTLGANVEALKLTGTHALSGIGNGLANTLTGNGAANTLDGGAGIDTLSGGSGDDILIGGKGADKLSGGSGSDTASYATATAAVTASLTKPALNTGDAKGDTYTSVENLTGSKQADHLTGNSASNILTGGSGDDHLTGGKGADQLYGGSGHDVFVFASLTDSTAAASGRDTIFDFTASDTIDLSAIDANSTTKGNQAFSFIGTSGFDGTAGELRYVTSSAGTDIYADTDGDRHADFQIHLDTVMKMVKGEFAL